MMKLKDKYILAVAPSSAPIYDKGWKKGFTVHLILKYKIKHSYYIDISEIESKRIFNNMYLDECFRKYNIFYYDNSGIDHHRLINIDKKDGHGWAYDYYNVKWNSEIHTLFSSNDPVLHLMGFELLYKNTIKK